MRTLKREAGGHIQRRAPAKVAIKEGELLRKPRCHGQFRSGIRGQHVAVVGRYPIAVFQLPRCWTCWLKRRERERDKERYIDGQTERERERREREIDRERERGKKMGVTALYTNKTALNVTLKSVPGRP